MDNDFREVMIVDYFRLFYRPLFSFVYVATKSSEVKGKKYLALYLEHLGFKIIILLKKKLSFPAESRLHKVFLKPEKMLPQGQR